MDLSRSLSRSRSRSDEDTAVGFVKCEGPPGGPEQRFSKMHGSEVRTPGTGSYLGTAESCCGGCQRAGVQQGGRQGAPWRQQGHWVSGAPARAGVALGTGR